MRKSITFIGLLLFASLVTASDFVVNGILYKVISPTEVQVTKREEPFSGVVQIPASVMHDSLSYTVSEIGEKAFFSSTGITEVRLPHTLKKIGDNAFSLCFSLKRITIPESVEHIGAEAFSSCGGSDTLYIPAAVTYIGQNAFGAMKRLKWIEVAPANLSYTTVDGVLFNRSQTEIVSFPAGREGHYDIPATLTRIADGLFNNAKLTSVSIPYGVVSIGKYAFHYCQKLESVDIPPSVFFIEEQAFSFCTSLREVAIPESVKSIEKEAFFNCTSLTAVDIPASISVVNERTFSYCTSLERVVIQSATVRVIDKLAFSYCTKLKELTLPSTVVHVGHGAFYPCKELTTIRVHHVVPLKLNGYVFSEVDKGRCKVLVPANSVQQYQEAIEWKEFKHFVPMNYRFTLSFSQPENGTLQLLNDSTPVQDGAEFSQSTLFKLSLHCDEGYDFDKLIINGVNFDFWVHEFLLMDNTKIEVKLKPVQVPRRERFSNPLLSYFDTGKCFETLREKYQR